MFYDLEDNWVWIGEYDFATHEGALYCTLHNPDKMNKLVEYGYIDTFEVFKTRSWRKQWDKQIERYCLSYYPIDLNSEFIKALEYFHDCGLYVKMNCVDFKKLCELSRRSLTSDVVGDGFGKYETIPVPFDRFKFIKNYGSFRYQVFERDGFKCVCCNNQDDLEVHHVYSFRNHLELGDDVSNGITLCKDCHHKYHNGYGYNSNPIDFINFIKENRG